jgi:3-oxoacyl-[acyl-carrier-protein] synthase II
MTGKRVVITGLGAVTPVGNDVESTWSALLSGVSGIGPLTTFDASTYPVRIGGMVKEFDVAPYLPDARLARRLSRGASFGLGSGMQALRDAGIDRDSYEPEERGIAVGTCGVRIELQDFVEMAHEHLSSEGSGIHRVPPAEIVRRNYDTARSLTALLAEFRGPMMTIATACSASAHAIGEAYRMIQEGDAKLMLAGGYDSLTTWLDVLGFAILGALTTDYNDDPEHASRPFDGKRTGFVIGEGGVMVVLEELESARARNAHIYGEVVGYGSSMNAYRITDSPPDGGGAVSAITGAMQESQLNPDQFDLVAAHGTGTVGNDYSETVAIKSVFGPHAPSLAVSSAKSMTGHLTAGAGSLNVLVCLLAMRDGVVPPTTNLDHPDPKLDLNYVPNTKQEREVRAALVNAFAFGGTNAALVLQSPSMMNGNSYQAGDR